MTRATLIAALLGATLIGSAVARSEIAGGWVGDTSSGCRVWNPRPEPNETVRWTGACVNGLANGPGTLQWLRAGSSYETDEGEWREGHQVGRATQSWPGGRYVGEVVDGLPHGRGALDLGRARYDGEFRDGKPDGVGTLTAGDKVYRGSWTAGCFNDGKQRAAFAVPATACR